MYFKDVQIAAFQWSLESEDGEHLRSMLILVSLPGGGCCRWLTSNEYLDASTDTNRISDVTPDRGGLKWLRWLRWVQLSELFHHFKGEWLDLGWRPVSDSAKVWMLTDQAHTASRHESQSPHKINGEQMRGTLWFDRCTQQHI
jgi:hypothetical protein